MWNTIPSFQRGHPRDLKTNSVLLTRERHLKITDFGLSLKDVFGTTTAPDICGTPGYAVLEMILAKPYSAAVDWFAFGVMMPTIIIGVHPVCGNTVE